MFQQFQFGAARCVFVYATKEEMQEMQKEYTALSLQTVTALYQSQ